MVYNSKNPLYFYCTVRVIGHIFESYVQLREIRFSKSLIKKKDTDVQIKTSEYANDKLQFQVWKGWMMILLDLFLKFYGFGPFLWEFLQNQLPYRNEYLLSACTLIASNILQTFVALPFLIFYTFRIEARYGFNNTTVRRFISDTVLSICIESVMEPFFLLPIIWIANHIQHNLHLWLFGISVILCWVLAEIQPFITRLFNTFTPVADEELRQKVEDLASQLKFPLGRIYQIDASIRSSHSNAYAYGTYWTKHIVLHDTLLKVPHEQIIAILAHEMGHWKKKHTLQLFTLFTTLSYPFWWFVCYCIQNQHFARAFGYKTTAAFIGIEVAFQLSLPIIFVLQIIATNVTRMFEYEADRFSASLGYAQELKLALNTICVQNLSPAEHDPLYSFCFQSHPSLVERQAALEKFTLKKD